MHRSRYHFLLVDLIGITHVQENHSLLTEQHSGLLYRDLIDTLACRSEQVVGRFTKIGHVVYAPLEPNPIEEMVAVVIHRAQYPGYEPRSAV